MATFTITLDDKVSGAAGGIIDKLGGIVGALEKAGVGIDQVNVKMGGAGAKASGMAAKFSEAISPAKGLEGAASGLGAALNPVTLGIVAVTVAAAAAIAVLTGLAFALFEGMRAAVQFGEMRAGITASLDAFTGNGPGAVAMLDRLADRLPFTTERMAQWSTALASAGVRDLSSLQRGVQAAAAATALMRDATDGTAQKVTNLVGKWREMAEEGKGEKFDVLAKRLRGVGVDLNDVARELGTTADKLKGTTVDAGKLGDAVQNALIHKGKSALEEFGGEATQIWAKFKEGVSSLFEDVMPDAKAFMVEVRGVFAEFDKGSASANVAKGGITAVFHVLFTEATRATHALHIGFLDVEIAALRTAIAIAPIVRGVRVLWRQSDGASDFVVGLNGVSAAFAAIGAVVAIPAAAIGSLFAASVAYSLAFVAALGGVVNAIGGAGRALGGLAKSAYAAAADFVSGLVNGIGAGIGRVVTAVKGLGSAAVGALKGILHIQSPSRVMAEVGLNTARGMAVGIDEGQSDVARAARSLGGAAMAGASSTSSSSRGGDISLRAELHVHNYGGNGLEVTEEAFGSLLQRLAMQAGIVPAGAPVGP